MSFGEHIAISAQLDFISGKAEVIYQAQLGQGFHHGVRSLSFSLFLYWLYYILCQLCLILSAGFFFVYCRMLRNHTA